MEHETRDVSTEHSTTRHPSLHAVRKAFGTLVLITYGVAAALLAIGAIQLVGLIGERLTGGGAVVAVTQLLVFAAVVAAAVIFLNRVVTLLARTIVWSRR